MADRLSRFFTIDEAAAELHVSPHTVRMWRRDRRITYVKVGFRVMIPREEVERIIREGLHPAQTAVTAGAPA